MTNEERKEIENMLDGLLKCKTQSHRKTLVEMILNFLKTVK